MSATKPASAPKPTGVPRRRPAGTVVLPRPLPRPAGGDALPAKVADVMEQLVYVYDYFTAAKLPEDLVKQIVLHHLRFCLERV